MPEDSLFKSNIPQIISSPQFEDGRGFFEVIANFKALDFSPVQLNFSQSHRGVLRGLHYQAGASAQSKIIHVISGRIRDVCVGLPGTCFQDHVVSYDLVAGETLYIPSSFAHGFLTVSESASLAYVVDQPWMPECERSVHWRSPICRCSWNLEDFDIKPDQLVLSKKDELAPFLNSVSRSV